MDAQRSSGHAAWRGGPRTEVEVRIMQGAGEQPVFDMAVFERAEFVGAKGVDGVYLFAPPHQHNGLCADAETHWLLER